MQCYSRAEQCGARQSKQEFLRRCRQMHAKHADGPEPGMVVHGSDRSTTPWKAAPVWQPLSHLRVLRTSACICVKPLLASPRAGRCCDGPRLPRASQNPMHRERFPAETPQRDAWPIALPSRSQISGDRNRVACCGASSRMARNETAPRPVDDDRCRGAVAMTPNRGWTPAAGHNVPCRARSPMLRWKRSFAGTRPCTC